MISQTYESPKFVEVQVDGRTACIAFEEAVSNPQLSALFVQGALAEAEDWNQRFAAFFERIDEPAGCAVVAAIRHAKESVLREDEESGLEFDAEMSQ
jgi:hypothetical protein